MGAEHAADGIEKTLETAPLRRTRRLVSTPCFTCSLPEKLRKDLEDDRASASPHSFTQLARYVTIKGHPIGPEAIAAHFRKRHQNNE